MHGNPHSRIIHVWAILAGKVVQTFEHRTAVSCLSICEEGCCLWTGSWDATVRRWRIRNSSCAGAPPPQLPNEQQGEDGEKEEGEGEKKDEVETRPDMVCVCMYVCTWAFAQNVTLCGGLADLGDVVVCAQQMCPSMDPLPKACDLGTSYLATPTMRSDSLNINFSAHFRPRACWE